MSSRLFVGLALSASLLAVAGCGRNATPLSSTSSSTTAEPTTTTIPSPVTLTYAEFFVELAAFKRIDATFTIDYRESSGKKFLTAYGYRRGVGDETQFAFKLGTKGLLYYKDGKSTVCEKDGAQVACVQHKIVPEVFNRSTPETVASTYDPTLYAQYIRQNLPSTLKELDDDTVGVAKTYKEILGKQTPCYQMDGIAAADAFCVSDEFGVIVENTATDGTKISVTRIIARTDDDDFEIPANATITQG